MKKVRSPSRRNAAWATSIALALWIIPSLGTQGMGTIGQRYSHPDRNIIDAPSAPAAADLLKRADELVKSRVLLTD